MDGIRFTHGGREWFAYPALNEANTKFLGIVKPVQKGRPFPTREQYNAARAYYVRLNSGDPLPAGDGDCG